jgi:hypothetical protein
VKAAAAEPAAVAAAAETTAVAAAAATSEGGRRKRQRSRDSRRDGRDFEKFAKNRHCTDSNDQRCPTHRRPSLNLSPTLRQA